MTTTEFHETNYDNAAQTPPVVAPPGEVDIGSEELVAADRPVQPASTEDLGIDPHLVAWDDPLAIDAIDWDTPPKVTSRPYEAPPVRTELMATPVTGPALQRHFTVHDHQTIHMGVEDKTLLHLRDDDGNEFTLLERGSAQSEPTERRKANDHYIDIWLTSHEAGLPVVPELFETDDDTLLVTDVKADGSEVYGKGMADVLGGYMSKERRHRPHDAIDSLFMEATAPENIDAIKAQAQRYSQLATQAGIELADDDPFELVVHPDGSWELMMLDLNRAMRPDPESTLLTERMARKNVEAIDFFIYQLVKIRGSLAKQSS